MRNWIGPKSDYVVENDRIRSLGPYKEKITGTTIGQILGVSPYGTSFTASAKLLGLWGEDISDKPAVKTGVLLEGRIIDHIRSIHPSWSVFSAEDVFAPREGDHQNWTSDWTDPHFNGHLDGAITIDGEDYVLEVKTARSLAGWLEHPPEHYLWQVYLYNHFMFRQDKAYIALGIVDESTYQDPYSWVPSSNNVMLFEIQIDREMVSERIEQLRGWYDRTVGMGMTDTFSRENILDEEILNHLTDVKAGVPELLELINLARYYKSVIDQKEESLKEIEELLEQHKSRIKDVMMSSGLTGIEGVKLTIQHRTKIDYAKAKQDGIDLSPYTTVTDVPVLKL